MGIRFLHFPLGGVYNHIFFDLITTSSLDVIFLSADADVSGKNFAYQWHKLVHAVLCACGRLYT